MQPITTLKLKVLYIGCNIMAIKVVITAIKGSNIYIWNWNKNGKIKMIVQKFMAEISV